MNYTPTQLAALEQEHVTPEVHVRFWAKCPEVTFEQSIDWIKKVQAGTHQVEDGGVVHVDGHSSLDYKVAAGLERLESDPVQVENWEERVQLKEIQTDAKSEDQVNS